MIEDAPGSDPAHDPGRQVASGRAAGLDEVPTTFVADSGAVVRLGIAGWTDPTLTAPGVFYPRGAGSAEARLRHYASRFSLVEVDSTYYALPAPRTAELWAERTPAHFVFDVKAYALMTGHGTEVQRLPRELRELLPEDLAAKRRITPDELPAKVMDEVWTWFVGALDPLRREGKLGSVLLQFPPWVKPTREGAGQVLRAARRLRDAGVACAVELRQEAWFHGEMAERTLGWLERHGLPFVMVDEPQGFRNSVPPLRRVTSPELAVLRMHGRRAETWTRPNVGPVERFRYLYDREELEGWVPAVREAASAAKHVHVVFNNCYGNYSTTNALELGAMLAQEEWLEPVPPEEQIPR